MALDADDGAVLIGALIMLEQGNALFQPMLTPPAAHCEACDE